MTRPPHPWNEAEAERLRLIHSPDPKAKAKCGTCEDPIRSPHAECLEHGA